MCGVAGGRARISAHKRLLRTIVLCAASVVLLALGACSTATKRPMVSKAETEAEAEKQRELIVQEIAQQYQRLWNVVVPMLERNVDLCRDKTKLSLEGNWGNKYSFGDEYESTMTRLGYAATATLAATGGGSALAQAGVEPGDTLIRINGWAVPDGKDAIKQVFEKLQDALKQNAVVHLSLATKRGLREVDVTAHRICAYDFAILPSDVVNAGSDGEHIIVSTGLMRFAQDDVEIATVFGHEMAHNVMGHVDKEKSAKLWTGLLGALSGGVSLLFTGTHPEGDPAEIESEADYVGLYLMARAGYSVDSAANIWRRMALEHPGSASAKLATDHPSTPERFVFLEKTAAEIGGKISRGAPLVPEFRKQ